MVIAHAELFSLAQLYGDIRIIDKQTVDTRLEISPDLSLDVTPVRR